MLMLILVSTSPRRIEILRKFKFKFTTIKPNVAEKILEDPIRTVEENSKNKVLASIDSNIIGLYMGVDTVICIDNEIIGKPKSFEDAYVILRKLSGRVHKVISGIYLHDNGKGLSNFKYVETMVAFRDLSDEEINWYISTGEPMDAAGGYKIQGLGAVLINWINGDYYNVIGLPITKIYLMIRELGYNPLSFMEK
ncbi:MAG: nucleoside triphosphate pyrophosphatase [Candidatus Methanomethylicia archaeon]